MSGKRAINYRDASDDEIEVYRASAMVNKTLNSQVQFDDWLSRYRSIVDEMKRHRAIDEKRDRRRNGMY
jgi:hypothetical protein